MTDTARLRAGGAPRSDERAFLLFLAKLLVIVFVIRSFVVTPFSIPSESMQPRLLVGDYLLAAKWPYGYSRWSLPFGMPLIPGPGRLLGSLPERGDVVIFRAPPDQSQDYIKRVIGLPGDTVQMRRGTLYLNGEAAVRQRIADFVEIPGVDGACASPDYAEQAPDDGRTVCRYARYRETLPGGRSYEILDIGDTQADDTPEYTVPEGELFLMGDNRDRSADSRFEPRPGGGIGFVPVENLVGQALFTVFSTDGSARWLDPASWFAAARPERIGERF